jgi:hypothetical protein
MVGRSQILTATTAEDQIEADKSSERLKMTIRHEDGFSQKENT